MVTRAPVSVLEHHASVPLVTTRAAARPRVVRIEVRRRRTLVALGGAFALCAVLAASGLSPLWWAALAVAVVAVGYSCLVVRLRRAAAEREMAAAFGPAGELSLDRIAWGPERRPAPVADLAPVRAPAVVGVRNRDLAAFVASWALGVALAPVVIAYRLAGGDLSDLERNGFMDRLARLQAQGRSQSVKVLAAGVVATAGVGTSAALLAPSTASASAVAGPTYTVVAGDTLGSIAAAHGTTVGVLAELNHLAHPNLLMVGQVLALPPGSATSPAGRAALVSDATTSTASTYTVVAGDTLSSIAAAHGTTVAALAAANHLRDVNLIVVGQALALHTTAAAGTSASVAGAAAATYTVRAGDTLGAVAARFGTTSARLAAINRLANPNLLMVGQVIDLRAGATSAPASTTATAAATSGAAPATSTTATSTTPSISGSGGASAAAIEAVAVARRELGVPYVWGGASPSGFDCSGLVMYAYAAAGVSLPHYTVSQYEDTARITAAQLEPGDLVFYDTGSGAQPGHVTMYVGDGEVISANEPGTVVQIQPIGWDGTILGYGRVG